MHNLHQDLCEESFYIFHSSIDPNQGFTMMLENICTDRRAGWVLNLCPLVTDKLGSYYINKVSS